MSDTASGATANTEINVNEAAGAAFEELKQQRAAAAKAELEPMLAALEGVDPATAVGTVRSINISKRKGGRKTPVEGGSATFIEQLGVEGDGHAADWHRQVSLLAWESVLKAQMVGLDVKEGDFAENITTTGMDLLAYPLGTQFNVGPEVVLEVSRIGKVCHTKCAIYYLAGDCIFPREGVFFVVLKGGTVSVGDSITIRAMGEGACAYTPAEALEEIAEAKAKGEL